VRLCEPPSCRVEIAPAAKVAIARAAGQSADGLETGGILLGHDLDVGDVVAVSLATGPGPRAVLRADYFSRDLGFAARVARLAYERDGLQWVGDWHTHPEGGLAPSDFDLANYAAQLDDSDLGFTAFVAVIVTPGADGGWAAPGLHAYLFVA
jgi:proteasome lid subunit RPN8/RPN11